MTFVVFVYMGALAPNLWLSLFSARSEIVLFSFDMYLVNVCILVLDYFWFPFARSTKTAKSFSRTFSYWNLIFNEGFKGGQTNRICMANGNVQ